MSAGFATPAATRLRSVPVSADQFLLSYGGAGSPAL